MDGKGRATDNSHTERMSNFTIRITLIRELYIYFFEVKILNQILLIDDHVVIMEGIRAMLEQEQDIKLSYAVSGIQALEQLQHQMFDLLLLEFDLPGLNGVDLIQEILHIVPNAMILIYSDYDIEPHYNQLIEAGISGYVPKRAVKESLVRAIRCAFNGETVIPTHLFKALRSENTENGTVRGSTTVPINERELTILKNLAKGNTNKEIAEVLFISQRTLEYSLTQLFHKLNVKSRKEAVAKSKQLGLLISQDFI
ncbi:MULTISPECIES: response regulator transcription factor [unclassified Paenibacillus]|uniref:response regulator n=1 Tax=unclassified Paenibacillus TaxID=185978 RepID=UPI001FD7525D|nr:MULTISPECIES: response regulator transcription factor [unclassified Paenibacillus]